MCLGKSYYYRNHNVLEEEHRHNPVICPADGTTVQAAVIENGSTISEQSFENLAADKKLLRNHT